MKTMLLMMGLVLSFAMNANATCNLRDGSKLVKSQTHATLLPGGGAKPAGGGQSGTGTH